MDLPHFMTSGMGGIRTSGDLVARMEYAKHMKLKDAKEFVAKKLGVNTIDMAVLQAKLRENGVRLHTEEIYG